MSFTRFVALPKGMTAKTLAPCLLSLSQEVSKIHESKITGFRIDTAERKLVVTFDGEDPYPKDDRNYGMKDAKRGRKKNDKADD
jgi:hypothetical protein